MGGPRSGREAHVYSGVVEDCLSLDVNKLVRGSIVRQGCQSGGAIEWKSTLRTPSIGYESQCYMKNGYIRLQYRTSCLGMDDRVLNYNVELMTTKPNFGGVRWWFVCPNPECNRMVVKLHQPPGVEYFLCRTCHNLTYQSCRDSGKTNPLIEALTSVYRNL